MFTSTINKIIIAVILVLGIIYATNFISNKMVSVKMPSQPVYAIVPELAPLEEGTASTETTKEATETMPQDLTGLLAVVDAKKGKKVFKLCAACHTIKKGDANRIGPNLWNIVGRDIASGAGFTYSDAMKSYAASSGQWSFESLDTFLKSPKNTVSGTKMTFGGVKNPEKRAALILWLRSMSDSPVELPK